MWILLTFTLVFFGLAITGIALIAPHNKLDGRKGARLPMISLGQSPILQLELARDENAIRGVLMQGDIKQNLADARAGNRYDTWLFIPGYAGFLFMVGVLLARWTPRNALVLAALVAVPVVAISDWVENAGIDNAIQHVANDCQPAPGDARRISTPSIIKWTLLVAVLLCYGATGVFSRAGWLAVVTGVLSLAASLYLGMLLAGYFRERFFP